MIRLCICCFLVTFYKVEVLLALSVLPSTVIEGKFSQLSRPEGIAFSPSGDFIATANLHNDSITFYARLGNDGSAYQTTPTFSIKGTESKLEGPHDVAYSPDGRYLAAVNRKNHSITIYKKNIQGQFDNKPIAIIKGRHSKLTNPNSVRYSPTTSVIAVANTGSNTVLFYRYKENDYEPRPYQILQYKSEPHTVANSLDFSSDGQLLAIALLHNHAVTIYQALADNKDIFYSKPIQVLQGPETNLRYPHSVSFHPTTKYLAVSNAEGRKNIHIFQKSLDDCCFNPMPSERLEVLSMYNESTMHLVDTLHQKGGCKGVAFSPEGISLAVTQNLTADPVQGLFTGSVLLIYPFK